MYCSWPRLWFKSWLLLKRPFVYYYPLKINCWKNYQVNLWYVFAPKRCIVIYVFWYHHRHVIHDWCTCHLYWTVLFQLEEISYISEAFIDLVRGKNYAPLRISNCLCFLAVETARHSGEYSKTKVVKYVFSFGVRFSTSLSVVSKLNKKKTQHDLIVCIPNTIKIHSST